MKRLALLVAVALLGGCLGVTTDSVAPLDVGSPGTWTSLAPMPTARQEVAAAALDAKVFVIGGFGPDAEPVGTVEVYDAATDAWRREPPLQGHVYLPGGGTRPGLGRTDVNERYTP
jgi:hypothetical protein